ncbi:MAG TPA: hypothetical protein VM430_18870 [Microbacterium sp.]|nr:hypothetical protein [Microbacterium sp.]
MAEADTLRARGNLTGSYVRPAGSDSWPPAPGTLVRWVASQPVQDMLNQGKRYGWVNLGTIGNKSHLQKHGDHTGHSGGKVRGVVYAKDTVLPEGGKAALLQLCRTPDYPTGYIDFFNIEHEQYNFAGVKVGSSGDRHLHVSIRRGHELTRITLFDDISAVLAGTWRKPVVPMPGIFTRLGFIDGASLVKLREGDATVWLSGRGKRARVVNMEELTAIQEFLRSRNMDDAVKPVDVLTGTVVL